MKAFSHSQPEIKLNIYITQPMYHRSPIFPLSQGAKPYNEDIIQIPNATFVY